jgi:hypothetical protein
VLIRELLFETDVPDEIASDLMDMITSYVDRGLNEIPMTGPSGIISYMAKLGQNLAPEDVMSVLTQPQFSEVVSRSAPDKVELKQVIPQEVGKSELEKSKDKITKGAEKQASDTVKKTGDDI